MTMNMRIGYGFDLHRWAENRRLVLGGVTIPHNRGLLGHSDADALTHAVIDALLGALALGDIGQHFPDTDPRFKDADSLKMLRTIMLLVQDAGYRVGNVDCTVVTDTPKLAPHMLAIRRSLAQPLGITEKDVSVKATRTEGVIMTSSEGLLAMATVILWQ